jgi:hypothetical protein
MHRTRAELQRTQDEFAGLTDLAVRAIEDPTIPHTLAKICTERPSGSESGLRSAKHSPVARPPTGAGAKILHAVPHLRASGKLPKR